MKKRISKILGIGLSAGLLFGLIGAIFAAPVSADLMKWGIVNTPTWEDLVLANSSDILDYDIGGDGDTIYAVLEVDEGCQDIGEEGHNDSEWALVKSEDGGVTWTDITANVADAANLPDSDPDDNFHSLVAVAVAPDDEDWLAVGGYDDQNGDPIVVASQDGGDNFSYTGDMADGSFELETILDIAVSIEVDSIHNIAVAGEMSGPGITEENDGTVFRLEAGTWLSASWEDTSSYDGWADDGALDMCGIVAVEFSPNFDIDDTIVCLGVDDSMTDDEGYPYLQSGVWETGGTWNAEAGFTAAVQIKANGDVLRANPYWRSMGFALPADYDGSDPGARVVYAFVNAINLTGFIVGGWLVRIDNGSVSEPMGPSGEPILASIDFHGDADTGKMIIGEYIQWDDGEVWATDDCTGVRVWHTVELDPCCPDWELACKSPSGYYTAVVMYTPDGDKAYATTSGTMDEDMDNQSLGDYDSWFDGSPADLDPGTPGDESAFSVSLDDGVSFNQIGLIDTHINRLSDFVVCPDCSTYYLATINDEGIPCYTNYGWCDSIWRSYDEGDTWERIYHGDWTNDWGRIFLRLACDAVEDCCDQDPSAPSGTIYMGIQHTNSIFYSRDCGQCWNEPPATKIEIQDFAVESENIVYVLDDTGKVSKSTQYGRRWSDAVDADIGSGYDIISCCAEGLVAVSGDGEGTKIAWSDDGGESFTLTDALPSDGSSQVHLACDPVCEDIIYAATEDGNSGGIYRIDLSDGSVTKISAVKAPFTGIAVANEGTLYALSDNLNFDIDTDPALNWCMDRKAIDAGGSPDLIASGVARNLDPCETDCCGAETWDYLICPFDNGSEVEFDMKRDALDICGCLSTDTNTILFAIDREDYAYEDNSFGSLWSYEDCAAKAGPVLTAPADGSVLDCEPCAGCDSAAFTLKWERMCEACSYDIQIMDADGNLIVEWVDEEIVGDPPSLFMDYGLLCGENYTWKVREANTSCECVHSPWSETWSFTIAVGAADAIQLLAPTKGAMDVPINNIGFSWTSVRNASSYSFVLSPNANLAGALVSQDMSTTAFNYVGPLDYSKAYYWQIIAWQDGTRLTTSSIGVFNTMAQPVAPQPPVVVEQQPAPVINIPPAQKITPTWIYAIIGIGAALAVVVIVLIVRTRRP